MRNRAFAVALLGLVVVAGVATGMVLAGTDAAASTHERNVSVPVAPFDFHSSERLAIDPDASRSIGQMSVDPIVATSIEFTRLASEYEANRAQQRIAAGDTGSEQVEAASEELDRLQAELDELYATEAAAQEAVSAGEMDARTFAYRATQMHTTAAAIETRANGLWTGLGTIRAADNQSEVNVMRGQLRQLDMDAETFRGAASGSVAARIAGDPSVPGYVRVASNEDGYEFATVTDDTYERQAFIAQNRDRETAERFDSSEEALAVSSELYPWIWEESIGAESDMSGELFWNSVQHPHGVTVTYFDGSTKLPFRESLALNLVNVPTVEAASESVAGAEISVDRTYVGGPATVSVVEVETGSGVDEATVVIDDTVSIETGSDGQATFIAPGPEFDVNVRTDNADTNLSVTVPIER